MYALSEKAINEIFNYLSDRPYKEVAYLVKEIQKAQPVNILPPVAPPTEAPKVEAPTECDTTQSKGK
jgi:hypothetical protein